MSVASNNIFALLGNDDDSDAPARPVKTVDKVSTRTVKRNPAPEATTQVPTSSRRGGYSGNEGAYRDRNAGSDRNHGKSTDEGGRGGGRGGYGARVRGGRGSRFPRDRDDRHSKGLPSGSDKQAAQSWGANEGNAELKDEQAGEEIAKTEEKQGEAREAEKEDETPPEPEDNHISYSDYLAQLAEKKLALDSPPEVRKANEGSKVDKKWASAKELVKEDDEDYFAGSGGKAKRERERKVKQVVEIDNRYVEPERPRGGRGGGRGAPRGEGRGARGEGRGARGEGRGARGEGRGARGESRGGPRGGAPRGAPRRDNSGLNTKDESAFPSLGS